MLMLKKTAKKKSLKLIGLCRGTEDRRISTCLFRLQTGLNPPHVYTQSLCRLLKLKRLLSVKLCIYGEKEEKNRSKI